MPTGGDATSKNCGLVAVDTKSCTTAIAPAAAAARSWAPCGQSGSGLRIEEREGRGTDSGIMQDLPHRGRRDPVAELDEFALHPPVAPCRILRRHADHELAHRCCGGWPPGRPSARVVPGWRATSR